VLTARLTTGFESDPSRVAAEIMTTAMTMPAMPAMAPANATRTSCAEPRALTVLAKPDRDLLPLCCPPPRKPAWLCAIHTV